MAEITLKATFATLDSEGNVVDSRAGTEKTGLEELSETLDGITIDGCLFTASWNKKLNIRVSGKDISPEIKPNFTPKTGIPPREIKAKKPEGKKTARLINRFLREAHKRLSENRINKNRKLPANCILVGEVKKYGQPQQFYKGGK